MVSREKDRHVTGRCWKSQSDDTNKPLKSLLYNKLRNADVTENATLKNPTAARGDGPPDNCFPSTPCYSLGLYRPPSPPGETRVNPLSRLTIAGVLTAVGCSTYQAADLPDRPAHSHPNRQVKHDFVVASELLLEDSAARHQFGPELRADDYFPVILYIENRGERILELQRSAVEVVLESGKRFQPVSPLVVLGRIERSYAPAYLLAPLIVPPFYVHRSIREYNHDMASNFLNKSFPESLRVEPGDPPKRFAFFYHDKELPDSEPSFASSVLEVQVEVQGTPPKGVARASAFIGESTVFTLSLLPETTP